MRILHLHGRYYEEGGAETYLRTLIHSQLQQGHDLAVIFADEVPVTAPAGMCETYFCGASHGLRSGMRLLPEFKRVVAGFSPDIIHLHVVQYDISPIILRWLSKTYPTVMTMHDTLTFCLKPVKGKVRSLSARIMPDGSPCTMALGSSCLKAGCLLALLRNEGIRSSVMALLERYWRRHLYRFINKIVVNSQFTKTELIRNHIAQEKIEVFPVPLNIPGTWFRSAKSPPAPPHLLFVGQLSTVKGAVEFVTVLGQLKGFSWKASMVGEGPDRVTVEKEIIRLGLDNQVELHGYIPRDELAPLYRRASIFVFPTLAPESLGLVGIEAMWFGLPVVAYNVGAIHEWLEDGSNGYLVSPGAIEIMAERIRRLLENKTRYEELSVQAIQSAQKWLDSNHSRSAFNALYVEVTGGENADRC